MEVLEAELRRGLVAELDQLLEVRFDRWPRRLARLPHLLPQRGVGRFLQRAAHLAVGDFLAVHLGAEHVERLLDRVRLGGDLLEQLRLDLLFEVLQVQQLNCRATSGSSISPLSAAALSALMRSNVSLSERAASILFCASSFFLKSSSLPVMFAFHHALPGGDLERSHLWRRGP